MTIEHSDIGHLAACAAPVETAARGATSAVEGEIADSNSVGGNDEGRAIHARRLDDRSALQIDRARAIDHKTRRDTKGLPLRRHEFGARAHCLQSPSEGQRVVRDAVSGSAKGEEIELAVEPARSSERRSHKGPGADGR